MAKWLCKCGQIMNDHDCPNKNGYFVFSEFDWDRGLELSDEHNRIHWQEFPDPTFDMYKCPNCGRLMVFGESNQVVFYKPELDKQKKRYISRYLRS